MVIIAECTDSDNGATDKVMNNCSWYNEHADECGDHDTHKFHAYSMCCACQGKLENIHITNFLLYRQTYLFSLPLYLRVNYLYLNQRMPISL